MPYLEAFKECWNKGSKLLHCPTNSGNFFYSIQEWWFWISWLIYFCLILSKKSSIFMSQWFYKVFLIKMYVGVKTHVNCNGKLMHHTQSFLFDYIFHNHKIYMNSKCMLFTHSRNECIIPSVLQCSVLCVSDERRQSVVVIATLISWLTKTIHCTCDQLMSTM